MDPSSESREKVRMALCRPWPRCSLEVSIYVQVLAKISVAQLPRSYFDRGTKILTAK